MSRRIRSQTEPLPGKPSLRSSCADSRADLPDDWTKMAEEKTPKKICGRPFRRETPADHPA